MDKMVSYKRYASHLVIANIIIATVWILLSVSLVKTLDESNKIFIISSMAVIGVINVLSAYFGITGIIRHYTCELTTFYIMEKLAILSETFLYLLIIFTDNNSFSADHPITSTVHTGVTIVLIITQIWLLYETRNFNQLWKLLDNECFEDFRVRGLSAPPNLCDMDKANGLYTLTDQLLVNPMASGPSKGRTDSYNQFGYPPPVYQPLSQPIWDETPQSFYSHWNYPSEAGQSHTSWAKDFFK